MRPVTDRYKVLRTKLAYIIDATVSQSAHYTILQLTGSRQFVCSEMRYGISAVLRTIPYNLYAGFLTIVMVFFAIICRF